MKHIYIIRHATAQTPGNLPDIARKLDISAQAELETIGQHIEKNTWKADRILCSEAVRTKETCAILSTYFGTPPANIVYSPLLYNAPFEFYLKVIAEQDKNIHHLAVVGHNPGISHLASYLAKSGKNYNLPTCGLVLLQFKIDNWQEVSMGMGKELDFIIP
jgi:phosphohistidine phosphatase